MGCSDSHVRDVIMNTPHEERKFTEIKMVNLEEESFYAQYASNNPSNEPNHISSKENEPPNKQEEKKGIESVESEDERMMKVKKARNFRIKPAQERFIQNIMQANRIKSVTEYSTIANAKKGSLPSLYVRSQRDYKTDAKKGNALQVISSLSEKSHSEMKSTAYSQKQAQKRLNQQLHKNVGERELDQICEKADLQMLDSSATIRL